MTSSSQTHFDFSAIGDDEHIAALEKTGQYRVLKRVPTQMSCAPMPPSSSSTIKVAIVDTETTGLDHQQEAIIELALLVLHIDLQTGLPCGSIERLGGLEDPKRPISAAITALTGIDNEKVNGKRIDDEKITQGMSGVDLVVAHHARFDRPFIEKRWPFFQSLAWACSIQDIPWASWGFTSSKLEFLAFQLGWFYDAHRAEIDCWALLHILSHSFSHDEAHKAPQTAWHYLIKSNQESVFQIYATGAPFEAKDHLKQAGYRWNAQERVWHRLVTLAQMPQEAQWLEQFVYSGKDALITVETLNASERYSQRQGVLTQQPLSYWRSFS